MAATQTPRPRDWYAALTLRERIALLRQAEPAMFADGRGAERAAGRVRSWRSQFPFLVGASLADRLKLDGITEEEFMCLLAAPAGSLQDRHGEVPAWLATLNRAFARFPAGRATPPSRQSSEPHDVSGFLNAIEPLISEVRRRVDEEVQSLGPKHGSLPFNPHDAVELMLAHLPGRLLWMLGRTMVLELHVARLQGRLHGETPAERFQSFIERLRCPETALAILHEYPVLARQLVNAIDNWADATTEFLARLAADWEQIRSTFGLTSEPGGLVGAKGNLGDSHRAARMVLIATFASGFKLVYKPRGLAVDVHFQDLLAWLNIRGARPGFRTLTVLDRGSYGWVEFANAEGCRSDCEVRRFYERLGGHLAVLYALEATDFHYENLVAAGEHPVLLDLEAFFHPRLGQLDARSPDDARSATLYDSVLSVGLLPQRIHIQATADSIDLSGIGRSGGERTPHRVPQWESAGTDEMRYVRRRIELTEGNNRPTLNGEAIDVLDYAGSITAGFRDTYQLMCQHQQALLAHDGPVAAFSADQVRIVLRPTWTYGLLLNESFHPDVLRDALDRSRLFDRLWVDTSDGCYQRVIASELEDLENADIPVFTARPDSRDLWTSTGRRIAAFFREPGMALVRRRIERLGDDDQQRQLWFIRASLASLSAASEHTPPLIRHSAKAGSDERIVADRERLLAAAMAVGNRLEHLALRDGDAASWVGLTLTSANYWCPAPLGAHLYHGVAGVALFLGYLGAITREERTTALAKGAMRTARDQLEHALTHARSIGAFEGWGGSIYALAHLGALWKQPELLAEAEEIVGHLPGLIDQDEQLDIIGGAAGCIGGLVSLYRCTRSERALATAIQCGERLLASSRNMEHGIGWLTSEESTQPLTGFSHGAAGMAWALLEVAALSGQDRFRRAAQDAIAYERSLFSAEASNWPDLRPLQGPGRKGEGGSKRFMAAWCHGATGIGLARLQAFQHLDDPEIRNEIEAALKTTLIQGFGGTHCLCHGDLGNIDLVLQADIVLGRHPCQGYLGALSSGILESIERHGWMCAVPLQVETPGLMLGLAGIGYGLLRLAEPARVPSVLSLAPPRPSGDDSSYPSGQPG